MTDLQTAHPRLKKNQTEIKNRLLITTARIEGFFITLPFFIKDHDLSCRASSLGIKCRKQHKALLSSSDKNEQEVATILEETWRLINGAPEVVTEIISHCPIVTVDKLVLFSQKLRQDASEIARLGGYT